MRLHHERTSIVLRDIAEKGDPEDRLSFATLVERLGDRGFGILLFLWALPNMIPIPGISTPFGLLIVITAGQMVMGRHRPWLPRSVLGRSIRRADFKRMTDKALPYLERFERYCKPRWTVVPQGVAERMVGLFLVVLGLVLILPIWGGNLPPAIAVAVIALGLIETDGVMVMAGTVIGLIALAIVGLILSMGFYATMHMLDQLFVW